MSIPFNYAENIHPYRQTVLNMNREFNLSTTNPQNTLHSDKHWLQATLAEKMYKVTTVVVPLQPKVLTNLLKPNSTKIWGFASFYIHTGKHGEAKRGIFFYNFCCKCTEMMSWKERVTKKTPTHLACRRNERCPDHPSRNHHSDMGVTRTHSHLSHSVAL